MVKKMEITQHSKYSCSFCGKVSQTKRMIVIRAIVFVSCHNKTMARAIVFVNCHNKTVFLLVVKTKELAGVIVLGCHEEKLCRHLVLQKMQARRCWRRLGLFNHGGRFCQICCQKIKRS